MKRLVKYFMFIVLGAFLFGQVSYAELPSLKKSFKLVILKTPLKKAYDAGAKFGKNRIVQSLYNSPMTERGKIRLNKETKSKNAFSLSGLLGKSSKALSGLLGKNSKSFLSRPKIVNTVNNSDGTYSNIYDNGGIGTFYPKDSIKTTNHSNGTQTLKFGNNGGTLTRY